MIVGLTSSVIIADPQPQNLADNGGPTMTVALPKKSPAINAGSNTVAPSTDQRGYPRDEQCDIGAYEYTFQDNIDFSGFTTVLPLLLLDD